MNSQENVAFITAQVALLNLEVESMKAENLCRQSKGYSLAYTEDSFYHVYSKYEPILGSKALIKFFES